MNSRDYLRNSNQPVLMSVSVCIYMYLALGVVLLPQGDVVAVDGGLAAGVVPAKDRERG